MGRGKNGNIGERREVIGERGKRKGEREERGEMRREEDRRGEGGELGIGDR